MVPRHWDYREGEKQEQDDYVIDVNDASPSEDDPPPLVSNADTDSDSDDIVLQYEEGGEIDVPPPTLIEPSNALDSSPSEEQNQDPHRRENDQSPESSQSVQYPLQLLGPNESDSEDIDFCLSPFSVNTFKRRASSVGEGDSSSDSDSDFESAEKRQSR